MSWRVTVTGDAEAREAFKEANFKKLYQAGGDDTTFEVPAEADADAMIAAAKEAELEATKEEFQDPLDDADPVSFW